jgi:hypothetical protein
VIYFKMPIADEAGYTFAGFKTAYKAGNALGEQIQDNPRINSAEDYYLIKSHRITQAEADALTTAYPMVTTSSTEPVGWADKVETY